MGFSYTLFPSLSDDIFACIRFQGEDYSFFYSSGNDSQSLDKNALEGGGDIKTFSLVDPHGIWTPELYGWGFSRSIHLMSTQFLFGNQGVAPINATIGVGILWVSSASKQRGVIKIGKLTSDSIPVLSFAVSNRFLPMQLRGRVEFSTVLYIADAALSVSSEEGHLANMPGMLLGELDKVYVELDGSGSIFPIVEVTEPVQPLWYLTCNLDDPTQDLFTEAVQLNLNRAHKHYRYLDNKSTDYDERLIKEIMASALTILITKLRTREDWAAIESGENLVHGSVAEAVQYFSGTLGWETSSPDALSLSIRKYFDRMMKVE